MTERDLAILEHIALYQLTTAAVVSHLWVQGKSADHIFARLRNEHLIASTPFQPGRTGYYTLTPTGAKLLKQRPSRPLGPAAVHRAVSTLAFCVFGSHRRFRMKPVDLERYLGPQPTHADIHCWQPEPGPMILRILAGQSDEHALEKLETLAVSLRADPLVSAGLAHQRYGFAVLVDRPGRLDRITTAVDRLKRERRIEPDTVVVVELADSPTTIVEKESGRAESPRKRDHRRPPSPGLRA